MSEPLSTGQKKLSPQHPIGSDRDAKTNESPMKSVITPSRVLSTSQQGLGLVPGCLESVSLVRFNVLLQEHI